MSDLQSYIDAADARHGAFDADEARRPMSEAVREALSGFAFASIAIREESIELADGYGQSEWEIRAARDSRSSLATASGPSFVEALARLRLKLAGLLVAETAVAS